MTQSGAHASTGSGSPGGPTKARQGVDALIAQHDVGDVQMAVYYLKSGEEPQHKEVKTGLTIITRDNISELNIEKYLYKAEC